MNELIEKIKEANRKSQSKKSLTLGGESSGAIPAMAALTIGLLFGRCHLIFGAYPLGIAAVSALPALVWPTLIGVLAGSLSLGKDNLILAVCAGISLLVRLFTCRGTEDKPMFGEGITLRMCAAVIGGFVSALYECIVSGFSLATILHSLTMILLTPLLTFVFSGLFSNAISITDLFSGRDDLSLKGKTDEEKYSIIFFQCSAAVTLFLISISLSDLNIFGIGGDFIFISLVTILVAKRFGAPRAMAVGFISALGSSGAVAVAFALAGLLCGILMPISIGSALISAGAAASIWSVYASGAEGLFNILPEYAIAATIAAPMLKSISKANKIEDQTSRTSAAEMAGIFSLSYKNKFSGSLDILETALPSISSVLRSTSQNSDIPTEDELRLIIDDALEEICQGCSEFSFCQAEDIFPAQKNRDKLVEILYRGEQISPSDINTSTEFCSTPEKISERINAKVAELYRNKFRARASSVSADQYDLLGKLISEARLSDRREKAQNTPLTDRITKRLHDMGFPSATAKAFGERKKKFIIAMEDEDGRDITRPEIIKCIEGECGSPIITHEFFRKEKCALLECSIGKAYDAEFAFASSSGGGEVSGDSAIAFPSADNHFFAICSDGMGSGDEAKQTSSFACNFLKSALGIGSPETALHLLNSTLLGRGGECSATIDIFALDMIDGSATFIKSGAAPSFIKRDSSIFRIKSATAPIGIMKNIDSEKTCVEVKGGDYVIMFSDGVSEIAEESPWLLELLTKPSKETPKAYAEYILAEAKKHSRSKDDMIVIVLKIIKKFPE